MISLLTDAELDASYYEAEDAAAMTAALNAEAAALKETARLANIAAADAAWAADALDDYEWT